ncbi:choice-of-anchor Q domain-containing protein [Haloferula sp.]|uniref:choice-of-anchor Q domain-containing protein n=1 Tax=Haloferula sp. TaxID=2497595 RepID=UPI0032A0F3B5
MKFPALLLTILFVTLSSCPADILRVMQGASGSNDGSTWADAFPYLRNALTSANPGDTIWLAQGVHTPDQGFGAAAGSRTATFQIPNGVVVLGGFIGTEFTADQRRPATHITTLSGDLAGDDLNHSLSWNSATPATSKVTENSYHVVTASNIGSAILDGLTITGGYGDGAGSNNRGSGLFLDSANLDLKNCIIINNRAKYGAAMTFNNGSNPEISDCTFLQNYADSSGDGGTGYLNNSSPTFTHCSFQSALATQGGHFYLTASSPTFTNCVLRGGTADTAGGAVFMTNASAPVFTNCSFRLNSADLGGGIRCVNATPTLQNTILWGNLDTSSGSSVTTTASASLSNNNPSTVATHSLVQNINFSGSNNNLDGTDPANDPLFYSSPDGTYCTVDISSPVIDQGDNSLNTTTTDLADNDRVSRGTIDLGAFEFPFVILYVDSSATGTGNGSSWTNAFTTLQQAFDEAGPGEEIWVAGGVHYPDEGPGRTDNDTASTFFLPDEVLVFGGFAGTETARHQRDPISNPTVLSGDLDQNDTLKDSDGVITDTSGLTGSNSRHVVTITGSRIDGHLDGFVVTAGLGEFIHGFPWHHQGNGFYCAPSAQFPATLSLNNCLIQGNKGTDGAGLFLSFTTAEITHCQIIGNESQSGGSFGGGGYAALTSDAVSFTNCTIRGNTAFLNGGGGYHSDSANVTCINSTFEGNHAPTGSGLYDEGSSSQVINSILWNTNDSDTAADEFSNNGLATTTFSHSLVRHHDLSASGNNLDGTDPDNDPLFLDPLPTTLLAKTGGNPRLSVNSPARNVGDNAANLFTTDLDGLPRINDTIIDLGAHEITPVRHHVDLTATGNDDGTSWADAFSDLHDALAAATNGDEIWITAGIYRPGDGSNRAVSYTITGTIALYGGFDGTETDLSQRDIDANRTILSGDLDANDTVSPTGIILDPADLTGNNAYTVLSASLSNNFNFFTEPLILDGLTVTGGLGGSTGGGINIDVVGGPVHLIDCTIRGNSSSLGGGIHVSSITQSATLTDCRLGNNLALINGGGIHGSVDTLNLDNCTIIENHANQLGGAVYHGINHLNITGTDFESNSADDDGGAVYVHIDGSATIADSTFLTNTATDLGGAINARYNTTLTLDTSTFTTNSADKGGAIHTEETANISDTSFTTNTAGEGGAIKASEPLSVTGSTFTGNSATGPSPSSDGGAISGRGLTLTDTTFLENTAVSTGGAVYSNNLSLHSTSLTNCSFQGNSADGNGGGVQIINGSTTITNSVFAGNLGTFGGGLNLSDCNPATLTNCSFQGNRSTFAGGGASLYDTTATITNTVAWSNSANGSTSTPNDSSIEVYVTSTATFSHSLLQNETPSGSGNLNGTLSGNAPLFVNMTDPALAPLSSGDLRLQSGSAARDLGLNSANATSTDLDGNARIHNGTIDLGAYEYGSTPPTGSTFATLFPGLDPDADANGNGQSNYVDYATGADPTAPHDVSSLLVLNGNLLTLPQRMGVTDVFAAWRKSDTLEANDWSTMVEGVDYQIQSTTTSGVQQLTTIEILLSAPDDPVMFFRQRFTTTP